MSASRPQSFLRIPPFPDARVKSFSHGKADSAPLRDDEIAKLLAEVKRLKVGGDYWARQATLPDQGYVLVKTANASRGNALAGRVAGGAPVFQCGNGPCDPWHLLSGANHVIADADDELALVAAVARVPLTCVGDGPFAALDIDNADREASLRTVFRDAIAREYLDPFTGKPRSVEEIVRLCGFWRQLIDANRDLAAAIGFGFWKRPTVAPLLWNGSEVEFASSANEQIASGSVAVWKSRTSASVLEALDCSNVRVIEVEDGFIRSAGLGADCVPPLSIVVDRVGIYFDPARPSFLEQLIQSGPFTPQLLQRARELRDLIVASDVSKYGAGSSARLKRRGESLHILVPGQVEDDRSVQCGGGEVTSNLELLRRVRHRAPHAYLIYKPHPDVEAGHRVGAIADEECLRLADEIVRDAPITSLIDLADEVHVNTSLAGFEALLRGKPVTTHGVPFYAGWGLTKDLGEVPSRRRAKRSLDELVAAALLLYPRYLDPISGLPCPPEVLVRRVAEGTRRPKGAVVQLRRLQGKWKKFALRAGRAG